MIIYYLITYYYINFYGEVNEIFCVHIILFIANMVYFLDSIQTSFLTSLGY